MTGLSFSQLYLNLTVVSDWTQFLSTTFKLNRCKWLDSVSLNYFKLNQTEFSPPSFSSQHLQGNVYDGAIEQKCHTISFYRRKWGAVNMRKWLLVLWTCSIGGGHCAKKPVTTMLTYPWKCTVLHCNHLGNTRKPLVLMTSLALGQ